MSEIEVAFIGICASVPELKTSKAGKPYCQFSLGVGEGDKRQWVRVCAFAETAEKIAAQLRKGGKAYIEGTLDAGIWHPDGKPPTINLNVAARRVEVLGQIGKNRPRQNRPAVDNGHARPAVRGDSHAFNDEIGF